MSVIGGGGSVDKTLPGKNEDLNVDSQHPHKKPGAVEGGTYNSSVEEANTRVTLGLAGQLILPNL